jgi:hypothetical protein
MIADPCTDCPPGHLCCAAQVAQLWASMVAALLPRHAAALDGPGAGLGAGLGRAEAAAAAEAYRDQFPPFAYELAALLVPPPGGAGEPGAGFRAAARAHMTRYLQDHCLYECERMMRLAAAAAGDAVASPSRSQGGSRRRSRKHSTGSSSSSSSSSGSGSCSSDAEGHAGEEGALLAGVPLRHRVLARVLSGSSTGSASSSSQAVQKADFASSVGSAAAAALPGQVTLGDVFSFRPAARERAYQHWKASVFLRPQVGTGPGRHTRQASSAAQPRA